MPKTTWNTKHKSKLLTLLTVIFSLVALIVGSAALLILLISVYHTLIWVATVLWGRAIIAFLPPLTLLLAIGVAIFRQPVHNLLGLISVFFSSVALYLFAGSEFLAFLFLIVYVGAIAILFLFVIMLLQLKAEMQKTVTYVNSVIVLFLLPAPIITGGLEGMLSDILEAFFSRGASLRSTAADSTGSLTFYVTQKFSDILLFSETLYTDHALLFAIAALLLLTAMLGAIVLAMSATDEEEGKSTTSRG